MEEKELVLHRPAPEPAFGKNMLDWRLFCLKW